MNRRTCLSRVFVNISIFCLWSAMCLHASLGYSDFEAIPNDHLSPVDQDIQDHFARQKSIVKSGNVHKPTFTKCLTYAPSIPEQQPRGLHVITVHAVDEDPLDEGGKITYSINKRDGDRALFKVNNETGAITTNYEFDRDEPSRMKEIYITVQATDNGRPALTDICTFKVTITDINDNPPSFDQIEFNEKVSEDLTKGAEVMRVVAYDSDDGDNARLTYEIRNDRSEMGNEFDKYFSIDSESGVLRLRESLAKKERTVFNSVVSVHDNPHDLSERRETTAPIRITVVGSDKRPPSFIQYPESKTRLAENFNRFNEPVVTLEATSNIDDPSVIFELVRGLTTQTNKDNTFQLEQDKTKAYIKVARSLDYETVTDYQLTVRCTNKDSWSVIRTIDIAIDDVNDEIPNFIEFFKGSVLENEDPGAEVMQVRAVDNDGTSANNIVSYELVDHKDLFTIDPNNGKVTTLVRFNREKQEVYDVNIMARDNSPSALTGKPFNSASQTFRITIEDINDNAPHFIKNTYTAEKIPENSDIGKDVIEVQATDKDTASLIHYKIVDGNIGDVFMIMNTTGRIKVHRPLDFEKVEHYNLTVEANDGLYHDTAMVYIEILNVNDELPVFEEYHGNITIEEELIPPMCIIELKAYDPDIKDRTADQRIVYRVSEKNQEFLDVDNEGCVKLIKKLDRDKPNGYPVYQAFIYAYDDGDSPTSKSQGAEIFIHLKDVNDNAPFLKVTEVLWQENADPGPIAQLEADDYDSTENGPPFSYRIASDAGEEIKSMFSIEGDIISANTYFDREQKKYYNIRIEITDSGNPSLTGVGILKVIIGDENDNPAQDGESAIFVYDFMGKSPDMVIGRVFVDDPDDWDLLDKTFIMNEANSKFELNSDNGEITLLSGTPEGTYDLSFTVSENNPPLIVNNVVQAKVQVTVKQLPEEAVRKSGSIRLTGCTSEEFISYENVQMSKKEILQMHLAKILNTSKDNVDIITVIPSPGNETGSVDVRFAAHGSPYYESERLNYRVANSTIDLERKLGVDIIEIDINECFEDTCPENCWNNLRVDETPAVIFTNRSSFVGVRAVVEPRCELRPPQLICFNGGEPIEDFLCSCPEGFDGPRCEMLGIGFSGNGWALYRPFDSTLRTEISLELVTQQENGLIFYEGPAFPHPAPLISDFISLELQRGYPRLLLSYGNEVTEVILEFKKLNDDVNHNIRIYLQPKEILLSVDDCHKSSCQILKAPLGDARFLNANGPLQVGGISGNIRQIAAANNWQHAPTHFGLSGCIRNLTYNGFVYNLGQPGESLFASPNCLYSIARAVSFRIDSNFLVAILVCIAILIILLLAVVVHRRKQDNWGEKDTDDIRETIISYEDEGGGEGDTGFDLSVLRRLQDDEYGTSKVPGKNTPEVPDISGFLVHKKDSCDRDPNSYPFDDVRYYAYEGGGDSNSQGSLSSLASCTDDGDLKFNYLSSFGPRFRKLADMYGEDPSDEDSQDGGEESWC